MPVETRRYGTLPDGCPVDLHRLRHECGIELDVIDFGATVTGLRMPDARGEMGEVCLGMASLEDYLAGDAYMGALVGRVAGRVSDAVYRWRDRRFELSRNEPPNHLHGGYVCLSRRLWQAEPGEDAAGCPRLVLRCHSPHGEDGYPGNLEIKVTYALTAERVLAVEIEAVTDRPTPFAPTLHAYFNLSGGQESTINAHRLRIEADAFVPIDEKFRLQGRLEPVVPGVNDFRRPVRLGEVIPDRAPNHGEMYRLSPRRRARPRVVASLDHPASGRRLEVATTESCLQFYNGKFLDCETVPGRAGRPYPAYAGLCLECQGYPDSPFDGVEASVLEPGTTFRARTEYRFGA